MTEVGKIKINRGAVDRLVRKLIEDAWAQVVADLDVEYIKVIDDPNEFADEGFTNQDIVDTERFRDSQTVDAKDFKAKWSWHPVDPKTGYEYAPDLYYGFLAFGKYWIPGRHWPERAIRRVDPVAKLVAELNKRGIPAQVIRNNAKQLN